MAAKIVDLRDQKSIDLYLTFPIKVLDMSGNNNHFYAGNLKDGFKIKPNYGKCRKCGIKDEFAKIENDGYCICYKCFEPGDK